MANQQTYTSFEMADMILCYGFCNSNGEAAAREYAERYPNRRHPEARTFSRIYQRLRETGSVLRQHRERTGPARRIALNVSNDK